MARKPKTRGLHTNRFKENPEEKRFALAWHTFAEEVIQWLGSPLGQCFLRDLGYVRCSNDDDASIVEKIVAETMEALREWSKKDPADRFNALVKAGIIDNRGRVMYGDTGRTLGDLGKGIK